MLRRPPPTAERLSSATVRLLLTMTTRERWTVRELAIEGGAGIRTTHERLVALRALGLVAWEDGRQGTLRVAVRPVRMRSVDICATREDAR